MENALKTCLLTLTILAVLAGNGFAYIEGGYILKGSPEAGPSEGGKTWTEPATGMEFIWVPGGCYEMGCGKYRDGRKDASWWSICEDDEPVHEVCVDGFWMGKYEVTQGEWKRVMGNNPSKFKKGDRHPVELVSWNDAKEFIKKLSSWNNDQYFFRLPTEAEWEYACRSGGENHKYPRGIFVDSTTWYKFNSQNSTHQVGGKLPNNLGLYDMSGNV